MHERLSQIHLASYGRFLKAKSALEFSPGDSVLIRNRIAFLAVYPKLNRFGGGRLKFYSCYKVCYNRDEVFWTADRLKPCWARRICNAPPASIVIPRSTVCLTMMVMLSSVT